MPKMTSRLCWLAMWLIGTSWTPAFAVPQVDLSVSGRISPNPLPEHGVGLATITVRNRGPDTAGATLPTATIFVIQNAVDITFGPAPFRISNVQEDCGFEDFFSDEDEQGHIFEIFIFYMGQIPAGQDRSCTYNVELTNGGVGSIPAGWQVGVGNDHDTNDANNVFPYTLRVDAASPVPATSPLTLFVAVFGILLMGVARRREKGVRYICRDKCT